MDLDYYLNAVLSLHFIATMALAGAVGYGAVLWQLNLRDPVRLYVATVVPGLAFLAFVFLSRWAGGGQAIALYPLLMIDWLIFANSAYAAVIVRRHLRRRGQARKEKDRDG
jgi:hypothetical protein